jgi:predicted ATP-binding protein involved in virulence
LQPTTKAPDQPPATTTGNWPAPQTLVILRGNSGSGKTSVARAVRDAYGRGAALLRLTDRHAYRIASELAIHVVNMSVTWQPACVPTTQSSQDPCHAASDAQERWMRSVAP